MHSYWEDYGQDIDGNRGQRILIRELDSDDDELIVEQIKEYLSTLEEDEDPSETLEVLLICPKTDEDVYFTIRIADYV